jgi:Xaa-Pro aminopeptidase
MKNGLIEWDHHEIPENEIWRRIEAIQEKMRAENFDRLILFGDVNESGAVNYFSNFAPYYFSAALILPQSGEGLMTTAMAQRGKPWIQSNSLTQDVRFERNYGKGCSAVLKELKMEHYRIGIVEMDLFPYPALIEIRKEFPQVEFIDATETVNELRLIRSPVEMNLIRRAGQIARECLEGILKNWNFQKECEVAAEIERQARYRRCEDIFVHITSHGRGGRWLHLPTEEKLEHEVMVELMVQYKNYWADIGRTIIPKNVDTSLLHLKRKAERIYSKAIQNLKPGVMVSDIFEEIKRDVNKGVKILSSIGFGLYMESMQRAWINDRDSRKYNHVKLEENMEIIFQFGLLDTTDSNKFLIQDTFLIGKGGAQNLTETSFVLTY